MPSSSTEETEDEVWIACNGCCTACCTHGMCAGDTNSQTELVQSALNEDNNGTALRAASISTTGRPGMAATAIQEAIRLPSMTRPATRSRSAASSAATDLVGCGQSERTPRGGG
jgi:hypothetical protein